MSITKKEVVLILLLTTIILIYIINKEISQTSIFLALHKQIVLLIPLQNRSIVFESPNIENRPRLFCWIMTSQKMHKERMKNKHFNWPAKCDEYYLFTDNNTGMDQTRYKNVFENISDTNNSVGEKVSAAINYIMKHYVNDFEWFLKASDYDYVEVESIYAFLLRKNHSDPQYVGYAWPGLLKTGHNAGYLLNQPAIKAIANPGMSNEAVCQRASTEIVHVRECLEKLKIKSDINTVVHNAFIPYKVLSDKEKLVLAWTTFGSADIAIYANRSTASYCPFKCAISSNKSLFNQADALLFHPLDQLRPLPPLRYSWQRYIFFFFEAPPQAGSLDGPLYNWTMTYQEDSTIKAQIYGELKTHSYNQTYIKQMMQSIRKKTKMVAWLVSHCSTHSKREEYVSELKKYISVDIFGNCANNTSARCPPLGDKSAQEKCYNIFKSSYRFYLSFENSVCNDYVTEKFYMALEFVMIPIVLRQKDYFNHAPKGSYIAADQFKSPRHLASYLHFLAENQDEYLKYFSWMSSLEIAHALHYESFCRLCRMLHENRSSDGIRSIQSNSKPNL